MSLVLIWESRSHANQGLETHQIYPGASKKQEGMCLRKEESGTYVHI